MKNELIDKSKGSIDIVSHKIFKGINNVFKNNIRIFAYSITEGNYNIIPCGNSFYYTNDLKMSESEFNVFIKSISL